MNIDTFCVSTTYLQTNALLLMAVRSYHKNNAPSQGGYVVAYRLIQPLTRQLTACYKTFNYNDVHHCATDCMLIDTATACMVACHACRLAYGNLPDMRNRRVCNFGTITCIPTDIASYQGTNMHKCKSQSTLSSQRHVR